MKRVVPTLAEVREKIDAVDTELLRLIDKRVDLARDVIAAKAAAGQGDELALRPAREAQIIRRLLASERRAVNRQLVIRIWRELMSESLQAQSPFQLITWGGHRYGARVAELARARFGYAPSMYSVDQPEQCLTAVKATNGVGVLAVTNEHAWWARMLVEPTLSIVATLPETNQWGGPLAMAVAKVTPEPSGAGDDTLWVTDSPLAAHEIEAAFSTDGVASRFLTQANGLKLFALAGFYLADDERLARAPGSLTGVVGVTPTPFDM